MCTVHANVTAKRGLPDRAPEHRRFLTEITESQNRTPFRHPIIFERSEKSELNLFFRLKTKKLIESPLVVRHLNITFDKYDLRRALNDDTKDENIEILSSAC